MNKKIIVISLVFIMTISLSACGSSKNYSATEKYSDLSSMPEGKRKANSNVNSTDAKVINTDAKKEANSEGGFVGYYKLIKFISAGEDITKELEELQEMGSGIYLIVNEDGTGMVNMLGEITNFDWDEKFLHMHSEDSDETDDSEYIFESGKVTLAAEGTEMTFVKMTDDEVEAYKNGETNKSVDQITDEILDSTYNDAMKEVDGIANEGEKAIDDAATEASNDISEAKEEFDSSYLPDLSASKHNDTGYYEIMAFQENGNTYTKDKLDNAGVQFDMMLCPDGKGFAHFIGTYYDLSWDDGTIYVATDEGQQKMIYFKSEADGKQIITINDSNIVMVFEYIKKADSTYEWKGDSGLLPQN